jgi:hypothetical protein
MGQPRRTFIMPPGTTPAQNAAPTDASSPAQPAPTPAATAVIAHDAVAAARRIAELEQKIGQQQLDLDFFRAALRHVGAPRR